MKVQEELYPSHSSLFAARTPRRLRTISFPHVSMVSPWRLSLMVMWESKSRQVFDLAAVFWLRGHATDDPIIRPYRYNTTKRRTVNLSDSMLPR